MNLIKKVLNKFFVTAEEIKARSTVYQKILPEKKLFNKPFYFKGNNDKLIILVHGWSSTPYSIRRLGEYLNKKGYSVIGPLLSGHGRNPMDLEKVRCEDWIEDLEKTYRKVRNDFREIYLLGNSMGASLVSILAGRSEKIKKIVLLAMPYKSKSDWKLFFGAKILPYFGIKSLRKYYKRKVADLGTAVTPLISYQRYPLKSILEFLRCIKRSRQILPQVKQPCLIIQAVDDHMIFNKSADIIYQKISSKIKRRKYLKNTYHAFISDLGMESVFEEIYKFLEE